MIARSMGLIITIIGDYYESVINGSGDGFCGGRVC